MARHPGSRIGPYEIVSPAGAGGMGEVYRARDARLDRDVAIKILPDLFASDPERLARFEREAKTLASLNHPNIAQIYGLEPLDSSGARALVMELVEGEDLSARIARGPIPLDEALPIARQIADALEAAHERGIIHRDLKPGNVKVRADGTVKVLDFGLAKALDPALSAAGPAAQGAGGTLEMSPTFTSPVMTSAGMILGTAAYMAPEQARGKSVDRRADVWAFGCLVFEMLSGGRVFPGEDVTETLAAIVRGEPAWAALPERTPPAIVRLLRRCLAKDPRKRLDSMAVARLDLDEALDAPAGGAPEFGAVRASSWREPAAWAVAASAILVAAVSLLLWRSAPPLPLRMSVSLPDGHRVTSGPSITRDGRTIAFASGNGIEQSRLYIRTIDAFELRELAGTEGATRPFFSPDGRWIAFFAKGRLFKLHLEGGAPTSLAMAPSPAGGTWAEDGTIVFTPTWNGGLYRINSAGGMEELIMQPDPAMKEYAFTSPFFLPGGRELLFSLWGATFNVSRLTFPDLHREILAPSLWTSAAYAASGHLLVGDSQKDLLALPYRSSGGRESPVSVVQNVHSSGGSGDGYVKFAVSDNGILVYAPGDITQRSLAIVDETGRSLPVAVEEEAYLWLSLSPDGRRAAEVHDGQVWLVELERGGRTPLSPQQGGAQSTPTWSRDGSRIFFGSNIEGNWEIYATSATRPEPIATVLRKEFDQFPVSTAPDGTLLFEEIRPGSGRDLWLLPPDGEPTAWLRTPADEGSASFSPNGRLIAYSSNASGRPEVYVQARDGDSARVQVSTNGGDEPAWGPDGGRIFYREGNALMSADLQMDGALSAGRPRRLFDENWALAAGVPFAVMPDGKRFLMIRYAPAAIPTRLHVVFNWFDELKKRAPFDSK